MKQCYSEKTNDIPYSLTNCII